MRQNCQFNYYVFLLPAYFSNARYPLLIIIATQAFHNGLISFLKEHSYTVLCTCVLDDFFMKKSYYNPMKVKVLSLLEACFLIWSGAPHFPWKFKSWAGKLLKIWVSNPSFGRSRYFCSFFFSFSNSSYKTAYVCF